MAGVIAELKRRNVFKVGAAYLITAWLLLQVVDVLVPLLSLPGWVPRFVFLLLVVGFVPALIFAWAYELTPDGIRREREVDRSESIRGRTGRKLDRGIIVMMALAIAYLVIDNYVLEDETAPAAEARLDKSIAVLPFRNRSDDEADRHFVDGIHDDILTQLSKVASLDKVISRTSTERYRDTDLPIPEIGEALGVATILEGGVQRAGAQVRINVQLIDAATDEHVWAETYDRALNLDNLFEIQSEIAREVVVALHGVLSDEEAERIEQKPTTSFAAYEEYSFGRHELQKRTGDSLLRAKAHFEKAIELDPDYAQAWVGLATVLALPHYYGESPETTYGDLKEAIDTALAIDPFLGEAYAGLGWLSSYNQDAAKAEENLLRAIELSPGYALAYLWYAALLRQQGRFDEAIEFSRKAIELDPLSPVLRSGHISSLHGLGRTEEARAEALEGIRRNPEFANFYYFMADVSYQEGNVAEHLRWLRAALDINPKDAGGRSKECGSFLHMLDVDSAERCVEALEADVPGGFPVRAYLFEIRGEWDKAAEFARDLLDEGANRDQEHWLVDVVFTAGDWDYARARLEESNPEYFGESDWAPESSADLLAGSVAATILYADGEVERANYLFDHLDAGWRSIPIIGPDGNPFLQAWTSYVRGDKQAAIALLRNAAEKGGIGWAWRYDAPIWDGMQGEPGWAELVDDIQGEMRRQREWYEAHKDEPLF
jgi:TolB-like protein/Flp pilus assembly protein TadD